MARVGIGNDDVARLEDLGSEDDLPVVKAPDPALVPTPRLRGLLVDEMQRVGRSLLTKAHRIAGGTKVDRVEVNPQLWRLASLMVAIGLANPPRGITSR